MYDFGGRKTSIARPFIKKELCNQRLSKKSTKVRVQKIEKKYVEKKVEKMLKIGFFFKILFSTFFEFLNLHFSALLNGL